MQIEAAADMEGGPETSRIIHLFAGVPVSDLDASVDWYERLFGRPPDRRVGHEMLWEMDEHAWLFIEPNTAQAGAGRRERDRRRRAARRDVTELSIEPFANAHRDALTSILLSTLLIAFSQVVLMLAVGR